MSAVLGELFDIKTGFYGVLISNFARLNLSSIVDEANDKHMKPWNELCARCGIRATPLDPYMDKEPEIGPYGLHLRKKGDKF